MQETACNERKCEIDIYSSISLFFFSGFCSYGFIQYSSTRVALELFEQRLGVNIIIIEPILYMVIYI